MSTKDDDRQQLLEGQAVARQLTAENSKTQRMVIRDQIARQFFGEAGIPPEMHHGWAALEQLREHREEVGYPLPPGGCLVLSRESVVAGCLAEMHAGLAAALRLETGDIKMKLEATPEGYLKPVADISVPDDWIIPVAKDPRKSPQEAARAYLDEVVKVASAYFREAVVERLNYCDRYRPALAQKVVWSEVDAEEA
jgi:hypothetical protein